MDVQRAARREIQRCCRMRILWLDGGPLRGGIPRLLLNRATRIRISRLGGARAKKNRAMPALESFATSVTKFVDLPCRH